MLRKRRKAVPVPPELLDALGRVHGVREAYRRGQAKALLWPWSRMTALPLVLEVIAATGIPDGPRLAPRACGRLRRAGRQPRHCPEHGGEMAGPRSTRHGGDLRERPG
jgi:hypothetical protein